MHAFVMFKRIPHLGIFHILVYAHPLTYASSARLHDPFSQQLGALDTHSLDRRNYSKENDVAAGTTNKSK